MGTGLDRCAVFVNYRKDDAGWTAIAVYDALCRELGASRVFLDHRSIHLGEAFGSILEDGYDEAQSLPL